MELIRQFSTSYGSGMSASHLKAFYSLLSFLCIISFATNAFSSGNPDLNVNTCIEEPALQPPEYFTHEIIPGHFDLFKAVYNGVEVIFRKDRIELFQKSASNSERSSFLIFKPGTKSDILGLDLISEADIPIPNPAMARVLGVETMTQKNYQQLKYENIYPDADLIVSIAETGLEFKLVYKNSKSTLDFELLLLGANSSALSPASAAFDILDKSYRISTDKHQIDVKEKNKLSFKNNQDETPQEITFYLEIR